jgi:serine/threonine protein kinase
MSGTCSVSSNTRNIIISILPNSYIVNMHYAFQDRENLFLVMDYMSGGDLRYHIGKNRRFNEELTSNINNNNNYRVPHRLYHPRIGVPAPVEHHTEGYQAREPSHGPHGVR